MEQYTLPFQFTGQSDATRLSIEATRQSLSNQKSSGGVGNLGGLGGIPYKTQAGSDMNNVVQYYSYATTNVSVNGSDNSITTGGVLNAGQKSNGTRQVLNNQSDATVTSAPVLNK